MFHPGFQMDYWAGSRTGKLVSYHMFKYTGQVCTSNCVFTAVFLSPLIPDCGTSNNTYMYTSYSRVCINEFNILTYFHKLCVYE